MHAFMINQCKAQASIEAAQTTSPISSRLNAQHKIAVQEREAAKQMAASERDAAKQLAADKKYALKVTIASNRQCHMYYLYVYMLMYL